MNNITRFNPFSSELTRFDPFWNVDDMFNRFMMRPILREGVEIEGVLDGQADGVGLVRHGRGSARTEIDDGIGDDEARLALLLQEGLLGHAVEELGLLCLSSNHDHTAVGVDALEHDGRERVAPLPALVGKVLLESLRPCHAAGRGHNRGQSDGDPPGADHAVPFGRRVCQSVSRW